MKPKRLLLGRGMLAVVVIFTCFSTLGSCGKRKWSKQEVDDWYAKYGTMVRWVGYQGSDEQSHFFIARVMDDWAFIQIDKGELQVQDLRVHSKCSSGQLYYYLVDPTRDFKKMENKREGEPDAAHEMPPTAQVQGALEPMNPKPQTEAPAGGGGR